jgi:hypothetical protein
LRDQVAFFSVLLLNSLQISEKEKHYNNALNSSINWHAHAIPARQRTSLLHLFFAEILFYLFKIKQSRRAESSRFVNRAASYLNAKAADRQ